MRTTAALVRLAVVAVCLAEARGRPLQASAPAVQAGADDTGINTFLQRLEEALSVGEPQAYIALLTSAADRAAATTFATTELRPGATRVVVQERDRQQLVGAPPGDGYSLAVDAFMEYGNRARVASWQVDIGRASDGTWRIARQERAASVESLYRLALNQTEQFDAKNFTVLSEDLELTLVDGTVFTVETDQGTTGLILLGQGEMRFHPAPRTEVDQVRIFAGTDTLESRFDAAFIRVGTLASHADRSVLVPRPVDLRDLRRAEQVFREESSKSFVVDLADLSRDTWSLLPGPSDFLAEVRTRRFDTLTYVLSDAQAEDISLFERARHRNIAVYASKAKLEARGPFFNEDDESPFDVLDYDVDVLSIPDRLWIEGRATMRIRVRAATLSQLTLRLADSLVVSSITSDRDGRLFSLRAANQNTVLVNLPALLLEGTEMVLRVDYIGRLDPQPTDREALALGQRDVRQVDEPAFGRPEPSFLYSNQSFWYPQPVISDYATATIRITVPEMYGCVASGTPSSDSPRIEAGRDPTVMQKVYTFSSDRPLRYLAFLVSRLARADRWTVAFDENATDSGPAKGAPELVTGAAHAKLDLIVEANPRQVPRGRAIAERAVDVIQFYESVIGDSPYSTFMLALVDSDLPGGHSPGYFAVLNQPLPNAGITWRNDPAAFANYPEFFLAHEVAHQWWGQAIGWRNYHEQWLSEGFAQYFAALYAQRARGDEVFGSVMRRMREWATDQSSQGPIYLGYRVGHIKNDGRAFRAVVYNKGASVLHMLRQVVGDEAFFRGLRRFYVESRFEKVGTDEFRVAMERESGRPLATFFERWVYNSTRPRLAFSYRVEPSADGSEVVLRFEQGDELFDVPVTVALQYADRRTVDVVVPVTEKVVEFRVRLQGTLRTAEISRNDISMADIRKN